LQQWQAIGNSVSDLADSEIETTVPPVPEAAMIITTPFAGVKTTKLIILSCSAYFRQISFPYYVNIMRRPILISQKYDVTAVCLWFGW